jgi:UDP-N-acetyl-D-mannosaminuronic acid dehydrogenase
LIFNGANVICSDAFVNDPEFETQTNLINKSDIIIIGVPHSAYKGISTKGKILIDIWNIT